MLFSTILKYYFLNIFLTCHHAKHGYSRETGRWVIEQVRKQTH